MNSTKLANDYHLNRNHQWDPVAGDIFVNDRGFFVVDYKCSLCTGITHHDGTREGCQYTDSFGRRMERQGYRHVLWSRFTVGSGTRENGFSINTEETFGVDKPIEWMEEALIQFALDQHYIDQRPETTDQEWFDQLAVFCLKD